jgi:hypothetical protein
MTGGNMLLSSGRFRKYRTRRRKRFTVVYFVDCMTGRLVAFQA